MTLGVVGSAVDGLEPGGVCTGVVLLGRVAGVPAGNVNGRRHFRTVLTRAADRLPVFITLQATVDQSTGKRWWSVCRAQDARAVQLFGSSGIRIAVMSPRPARPG
jgi:hypothetical protein